MVIIDVEYYLSYYLSNTNVNLNFLPELPVNIPLSDFGSWTPISTSVVNFLFNPNSYSQVTINYMFYQFASTSDVETYFNGNTLLINRICSMMNITPVYVCSTTGTQNIFNFSDTDIEILFQLLNKTYNSSLTSTNNIINNLLLSISITNNYNIPVIDYSNMDNVSQLMFYITFNNLLNSLVGNPVTELP